MIAGIVVESTQRSRGRGTSSASSAWAASYDGRYWRRKTVGRDHILGMVIGLD